MKERLVALSPILLRVVGYPLFFLVCFTAFLYATFPYDRLKEVIEAAAQAPRISSTGRQTPSNMELSIGSLGPTFFPGVKAKNVDVTFLPQRTGDRPVTMHIDAMTVHVSLFALLARKASVTFDIDGMGGEIEGSATVYFGKDSPPGLRDLEVEIEDVQMGELAPLVSAVGLPLGGTMTGTVELHIPEGQTTQAEGNVRLTCERVTVGDGRAKYRVPSLPGDGLTIEQIKVGKLDININVRRGTATFDRVGSHSDEFDLQVGGRVDLRPNLGDSAMNLNLRFRLTDVYRAKSERTQALMSAMDFVPDLRRARSPEGTLGFRCSGTFDRPMACLPDQRGAGGGAGGVPQGLDPNAAM